MQKIPHFALLALICPAASFADTYHCSSPVVDPRTGRGDRVTVILKEYPGPAKCSGLDCSVPIKGDFVYAGPHGKGAFGNFIYMNEFDVYRVDAAGNVRLTIKSGKETHKFELLLNPRHNLFDLKYTAADGVILKTNTLTCLVAKTGMEPDPITP